MCKFIYYWQKRNSPRICINDEGLALANSTFRGRRSGRRKKDYRGEAVQSTLEIAKKFSNTLIYSRLPFRWNLQSL